MPAGDQHSPEMRVGLMGQQSSAFRLLGCTAGGYLYATDKDTITSQRDVTLNDSDKTFTVPASRIWHLHTVHVNLTATATSGNRRIVIEIRDDSDNIFAFYRTEEVAPQTFQRIYTFSHIGFHDNTLIVLNLLEALPDNLILPAGWDVHIYDIDAVDPTADDMIVGLTYNEFVV